MPTLLDLSHTVEHGMITYKGLPAPIICDYLSREESRQHYAEGVEFNIGKIEMVANTGTYIDSPFHRYAHGKDLSELPLTSLADLEGVLVHVVDRKSRGITREAFKDLNVRGKAVLVHTEWSQHWRTDQYFEGHPFLTKDAAEYLTDQGVKIVGIDTYNIDDTTDGTRPVHSTLLGNEIPIVEHITGLAQIPKSRFSFLCRAGEGERVRTFPIRAFAITP